MSVTLTIKEIKDLAEFAGLEIKENDDQGEEFFEIELTIFELVNGLQYAHGAYFDEYPEEGHFPLGDKLKTEEKDGTCKN